MKAIVFGASGQAGSYMVELLNDKKYEVLALCPDDFDFTHDTMSIDLKNHFRTFQPDEVYNFAGKQYAPHSWASPEQYMAVNGTAVLSMLFHLINIVPSAKFFNAGSAEVFEKGAVWQYEGTKRKPTNPYGCAKLFAEEIVRIYRDMGMFACTGIFFNMESPRRKNTFFAEKVVSEAVRIRRELDNNGQFKPMQLGRLDARRDWGWTEEYVEVAWRMLQQDTPDDYVIGTGECHSCLSFVIEALKNVGIRHEFTKYFKYEPAPEGETASSMHAQPFKAEQKLGWRAKYKFADVVKMLVHAEMERQVCV
jgi:GDPmannose 4,6-dehydratase